MCPSRVVPLVLACLLLALGLVACGQANTPAPTETVPPATDTLVPRAYPPPAEPTAVPATPTPGPGSTRTVDPDGMVQVYVPAGEFKMGQSPSRPLGQFDEVPQHTVVLDAFWIDRTEVTNAQYALCVQAGACTPPAKTSSATRREYFGNPEFAAYPVVELTWNGAESYCAWAGRRLPTEAEWEKAARGTDERQYPWGDTVPAEAVANVSGVASDTVAVGAYPGGASPYGALDMAGNVWEWVADWYDARYYAHSPEANPPGPAEGERRVLRGGAWTYKLEEARTSQRYAQLPDYHDASTGFRCAR